MSHPDRSPHPANPENDTLLMNTLLTELTQVLPVFARRLKQKALDSDDMSQEEFIDELHQSLEHAKNVTANPQQLYDLLRETDLTDDEVDSLLDALQTHNQTFTKNGITITAAELRKKFGSFRNLMFSADKSEDPEEILAALEYALPYLPSISPLRERAFRHYADKILRLENSKKVTRRNPAQALARRLFEQFNPGTSLEARLRALKSKVLS